MFLKSLQWRLVSFFCLIAFCLIIPIGLFLAYSVEDRYYRSFIDNIDRFLSEWNSVENAGASAEDIYRSIREGRNISLFYIIGDYKSYTVVNTADKNDIYSSDARFDPEDRAVFFDELLESRNFMKALRGQTGKEKRLESLDDKYFFDYAVPAGKYVLYFRYYKDEWQSIIDDFNNIIVTSLIIAFAIALLLGYVLSKTVTVPIVDIMHKARDIASGNFDKMLEVKSDDEIGKLTSTVNYMAMSLKDTLLEISSQKNKMETILNHMTDGIIAFNLKGEVIHTNPASRQMLGEIEPSRKFDDYARKYGLEVTLQDLLNPESSGSREVAVNSEGKTVRVYFAVFTGESNKPEGVIAVLQDITEQQKLENMRKEFVANVSHELRTPLTSIKSYAETLLEGALEERETCERFLKVINSEADRMTRLVKDLLQLSRLDNRQMQWKMREVSVEELVRGTVEKMAIEANNKKQRIECVINGKIPKITADYDRIEQVMLNILSNAIKYTPEGGRISIHVSGKDGEVYVKVADTGIGIPAEDMPRIFERFYRVDKARSREMGGTGLGLAIAKEIVEAHSGTISLKSQPGKGTEVLVKLPVAV